MNTPQVYIALLRGINTGGHHKVPMVDLSKAFQEMGFVRIKTLLNSGNIIFEGESAPLEALEEKIRVKLESAFGFPIPVLMRKAEDIHALIAAKPFEGIKVHKEIRLYVTFLTEVPDHHLPVPWISPDGSFRLLGIKNREIFSVLDISTYKTPDAMKILEQSFGKDITTRNWNTIEKIATHCSRQAMQ